MKRKTLFWTLVVIVIIASVAWWLTRPESPSDRASVLHNGLAVSVAYSRPYKKGRVIFGDAGSGALQPHGQYWRLGANDATEITFNRDVSFGGSRVKGGTYRMYAVPGAQQWEITLNSALGKSGSEQPDHSLDVVTIQAPVSQASAVQEQFSIQFKPSGKAVVMKLQWDRVVAAVEIL